jgi:4-hydroxy-3-polyprenylbenzoate decarboxylase
LGDYIIAITGASGSAYARRLVELLIKKGHDVLLTISNAGQIVLQEELGWKVAGNPVQIAEQLMRYLGFAELPTLPHVHNGKKITGKLTYYDPQNIGAPIASGSVPTKAMIIIPCSMGTISGIACGASSNLIERAADVVLKERRPLIVVPRETPLNAIHLRNLLTLAELGVHVVPAMPAFYHRPEKIQDLIDFMVGRILNLLEIEHNLFQRWPGGSN